MMKIENIPTTSDPQPTIAQAMAQMVAQLDKYLADMMVIFERDGNHIWSTDAISHTVTAVPGETSKWQPLFGRPAVGPVRYVATGLLTVSYSEPVT
ncbi:hypothetical protein [Arthrobacter rhombi]|uniref:hypothetical protein n=1 Tax=Arthrobacter rhombi TaxID=71253 RepID=UPI003F91C6C5